MSQLERRLHEALLKEAQAAPPAPDLFERVRDSIDADQAGRARRVRTWAAALAALVAIAGTTFALSPRNKQGDIEMPWWWLEIGTNLVLIGVAVWLGPFIKRFGRAYAGDVFRGDPLTGKSYIVLTDVVYYLIFSAYILFVIRLEPIYTWADTVSSAQLKDSLLRIAGILFIIGVLHGLNILVMPLLGRLFAMNRRDNQ